VSDIDAIDIEAAANRLHGVAHRTPILTCAALDEMVGAHVFIKAENFQRVGAFKFRGAFNRVSTLSREQLSRGVVASSSGNHAQALALAARLCQAKAIILMPDDAPNSKLLATRAYGAEVVFFDRYDADRELLTAQLADERGATIVHAYDDPYVIAGAGTTGREIMEHVKSLDMLVVPTGGGGLLAGSALAAREARPNVRIFGVEPGASDDWQRSLAARKRVTVEVGPTIADGQQLSAPGQLNFEIAAPLLEGVVTVTDNEIRTAMRFLFERLKIVAEPSGATAVAALMFGMMDVKDQRVAVIISGGNIDVQRFFEITSDSSKS
jgi:threo-3-hydroxy-L-aspartate ammonia-lyase